MHGIVHGPTNAQQAALQLCFNELGSQSMCESLERSQLEAVACACRDSRFVIAQLDDGWMLMVRVGSRLAVGTYWSRG